MKTYNCTINFKDTITTTTIFAENLFECFNKASEPRFNLKIREYIKNSSNKDDIYYIASGFSWQIILREK